MNAGKIMKTGKIIYDGKIRENNDTRLPGAHGPLRTRGLCPRSLWLRGALRI